MRASGIGAIPRSTQGNIQMGTITRLRKIVPEALDTCTPELNKKFLEKLGITSELSKKDTHAGVWTRL